MLRGCVVGNLFPKVHMSPGLTSFSSENWPSAWRSLSIRIAGLAGSQYRDGGLNPDPNRWFLVLFEARVERQLTVRLASSAGKMSEIALQTNSVKIDCTH